MLLPSRFSPLRRCRWRPSALPSRTMLFSTALSPLSRSFDASPQTLSASGQFSRIVFGPETAATQLGTIAKQSGIHKMLVVRDRDPGAASRAQYAEFLLMQHGIPCFQHTLQSDCATPEDIDRGVDAAIRVGADGILAFGSGNTIDMTRAIALALANDDPAEAYLRGTVTTASLAPPVPHLIVPTIAGSGAEVSTEALVLDELAEAKRSFVAAPIHATAVLIDPMLALSVPLPQTIQGALTALGQCMESFLLGSPNDAAAEAIALQGIDLVASALAKPLVQGRVQLQDLAFRQDLALASLASSIAATASGFGAAHAIAVSMGGISELPHCQIASGFLPFVFDRYAELVEENDGDDYFDQLNDKLEQLSDRLTACSGFQASSIAAWLRYVAKRFALPDTSELELDESLTNGMVDRTVQRLDEVMQDREEDAVFEDSDVRAVIDSAVVQDEPPVE